MRKRAGCIGATVVAAALAVASAARPSSPAPRADVPTFMQLPAFLPSPYAGDGDVDAQAVDAKVDRARAEARRARKLLLIEMGANWCADCRILAGVMDLPHVRRFVDAHYVVVTVDCGPRMEWNLQVAARYGVSRLRGVPSLFVVDPRSDRLLDAGRTDALVDARFMTPQGLADWLAQWP